MTDEERTKAVDTMGDKRAAPADTERFARKYGQDRSDVALLVEREVFGVNMGANGYTTVEQAARMVDALSLRPGMRLVELGSGRGWPGVFVANRSGCRVVLTDVPPAGLRTARLQATGQGVGEMCRVVAANGAALPLRSGVFDAAAHADVLC